MKPRVLVLTETYLPGYLAGGPVRSLASLVHALGDDIDWAIVTRDRDFQAKQAYEGVVVNSWTALGKAQVFYSGPGQQRATDWLRILRNTKYDVLYLNSFFSVQFSMFPMMALRLGLLPRQSIIIAPRGEFSAGALELKAWKKRPALAVCRALQLHKHVTWHASTPLEAADIQRETNATSDSICVARNLALPLQTHVACCDYASSTKEDVLRVVFASRMSRKKNLSYALRILRASTIPVHFCIVGPPEDLVYWQECQISIGELPANVTVEVKGPMTPGALALELPRHDLFFLPTMGENYGHALVEAWQAGLLVLTSDQTPWRDLEARGLGWDLALRDERAFGIALEDAYRRSPATRQRQREMCAQFGASVVNDAEAVHANRGMFLRAAGLM